ncbi:MAG: SDR family NAD(P)-dependent oxidoreductase [Bdellovibrionales bacterium]|nr:SDR family NAD(P)-dependent oxidoreductase [Bdellovibrionales bacterium]
MRSLVTGGFGFVGRHLAHHLVSCGDDVAVTYQAGEEKADEASINSGVALPKSVQTIALDVCDKKAVNDVISLMKPDAVYHLAAKTFVPDAERQSRDVFEVNLFGTLNILDALVENSPSTRVLFVSSAEVYGEPRPGSLPINEDTPLRPISIYGVTKAAADVAVFKYAKRENLHAVRIRPFPHLGPGQGDRFAISSFAKQIAEIKLGRREPVIYVGNLEAKRDYSDVSDIVRGYREALLNGKRGEAYTLCSGKSVEIGEVLQQLIKVAEVDVEIQVDQERLRPVDIPDSYGTFARAQKDFGWKPRIDLEGTLHSILAYWLENIDK